MNREQVLKLTPHQRARQCTRRYFSAQTERGIVLVSFIDGFTYHDSPTKWYGGTFTSIDPKEPVSLIKDYGTDDGQACKDFARENPPASVQPHEYFYGWVSPDGLLYEAAHQDHSGTAFEIVEAFDLEHDDFSHASDVLYFRGWISVGMVICLGCHYNPHKIPGEPKMTVEQKTVIERLISISADKIFIELAKEFLSWQHE